MGNISQSVIDEARSLNDAGQVQLAYQVLSSAGDNYSGWAADIVGESGGLFQGTVRSLWENQVSGSTQHFDTVAAQHQSNYITILENNQGRLPTTYEIENSYVSALADSGLPPSLAIDVVINTAYGGVVPGWFLAATQASYDENGQFFTSALEWYEVLGIESDRRSNQEITLDSVSPSEAYNFFFAAGFSGALGAVTASRHQALIIQEAVKEASGSTTLGLNDSSFLNLIEQSIELAKSNGTWGAEDQQNLISALQQVAGSELNLGSAAGVGILAGVMNAAINGNQSQLDTYYEILGANAMCFGPEVPIDMWPLEPEFAPDPKNPFKQYDQDAVRAKIWKKPIHKISVGDWVVSHDKNGNMVPGYVPRTMTNDAKILLDFHGTRVTPGHVYYRPDSKRADKYETLIDVLRDDGMIEDRDGVKLRAATYAPVDGPLDKFVKAVTGTLRPDGGVDIKEQGRIRLGTRFIVRNDKGRKDYSVADLIEAGGGVVGDDELIRVGDGPGIPFHWDFGDTLPKPEDFVLAASGTTLEDIYKAAEWESQGPRLPAPMVLDGGPVQSLKGAELSAMPRNEPLNLGHMPEAPQKPQRMMNRKQRKAMEAKSRKAAKARKRAGS